MFLLVMLVWGFWLIRKPLVVTITETVPDEHRWSLRADETDCEILGGQIFKVTAKAWVALDSVTVWYEGYLLCEYKLDTELNLVSGDSFEVRLMDVIARIQKKCDFADKVQMLS